MDETEDIIEKIFKKLNINEKDEFIKKIIKCQAIIRGWLKIKN